MNKDSRHPLKQPLLELRALVVDEGALSRSVICTMLRDYGIGHVSQAPRPEDALRMVRNAAFPYDLVVCEFNFSSRTRLGMSGQDLLDDLRQSRGLPMSTAFIMVTDEARYQYVADSVEGALDDYLLKPFSTKQFEERLAVVLERKRALKQVFSLIEAEDFKGAAAECETIFARGDRHRLYAARIGTELQLRLRDYASAQVLFEAVIASKAIPWARLGLARVQLETVGAKAAHRALESLIAENPGYADGYDVLGRAQVEELQLEDALSTYERAVELTPANVSRLQKVGSLALALGRSELARRSLDSAFHLGQNSRSLDYQSLFQLALVNFDLDVHKGWERPKRYLETALSRFGESFRVRSLLRNVETIELLARGQLAEAEERVSISASDLRRPGFDFEMACNLLQLLSRLEALGVVPEPALAWAQTAAERFGVSRPSHLLLGLSARSQEGLRESVNIGFSRVNEATRAAMSHVMQRDYERTARELVSVGTQTLNAKVFALAQSFLERHGPNMPQSVNTEIGTELSELGTTYAAYGTHARVDLKLRAPRPGN